MSQKHIPYSIGEKTIMVIIGNRPRPFSLDSDQGKKLKAEVLKVPQDTARIEELADIVAFVAKATMGRVVLDDRDQLRLDGKIVDYGLTSIIVKLLHDGSPVDYLGKFLVKVAENPNQAIANDLYSFLSVGMLPIEPDGDFLAFKRVRDDFMDIHSGTVSYKMGETPWMDREKCDPNGSNTCSRGLHACSYDYLPHFGAGGNGGHVMIVKINPRDVTAIPADYNNTKLRCCRMEVIGEVPASEAQGYFSKPKTMEPTADDAIPDDDATVDDGVSNEIQAGPTTIMEVQDLAESDGAAIADTDDAVIENGENYEKLSGLYNITYPIHFILGYLDHVELDEYHSERAYEVGLADARRVFEAKTHTVETSFDWTNGACYQDIPEEHEHTYMIGYITQMLGHQAHAYPDA